MAQRLDVQGAKLAAEQTAKNLGLTRTTRFINVLELGLSRKTFNDRPDRTRLGDRASSCRSSTGATRAWPRPRRSTCRRVDRAAETAVDARSEVREAYVGYRAAYDIARHYRDEIVPLRQRISEENLLRYNGMLIGVFELLADARAQIASVSGCDRGAARLLDRQADLDMALVGKPGAATARPATAARCRRRHAVALSALNPRRTENMVSRRKFLGGAGAITAAVSAAAVSKVAMAALPEPVLQTKRRHHAAAGAEHRADPTTRWSRSTAGPCPGA